MKTITMPKTRIVLPDTSLCAIVRDELMNPAKGIVDFVDSTLPYVEAAVIVDTGSEDGTREALEELKAKYPHLEVLDLKFQGFAHARNFSLDHCKTRRALVLDADERFTRDDFGVLAEEISATDREYHSFEFKDIYANGETHILRYNNPRLFDADKIWFEWEVSEEIVRRTGYKWIGPEPFSKVQIKHFLSSREARLRKRQEFYAPILAITDLDRDHPNQKRIRKQLLKTVKAPSTLRCFKALKKKNPYRELYR